VAHGGDLIKQFDLEMLKAEKRHLFPDDNSVWHGFDQINDVDIEIERWSPDEATNRFLAEFYLLIYTLRHFDVKWADLASELDGGKCDQ